MILLWILLGIGILVLLVGIIVFRFASIKEKRQTDYRAFFIMGVCFLPMGVVFTTIINVGFLGLTALGLIYMIIGLANRDKWGKQVEASPTRKKKMAIVLIGLVIAALFGLVFFLFRIVS